MNEWNFACCALYRILYVVDLVEGKAHPLQDGTIDFDKLYRNTVGLFLRTMKSYFSTGIYVIIDSGFCVLKGLIGLRKKGLFSCDVVKKRRYWPSMVPSKYMEDNLGEVDVGDKYTIQVIVDDVI